MKYKTYIITDEENTLMGLAQTENRSQAMYICFKYWERDLGCNLLEFSKLMKCARYKELDDIDFSYFDGRDFSKEYEELNLKELREEVLNYIENEIHIL